MNFLLPLFVALLVFVVQDTLACSCMPTSANSTLYESWHATGLVFRGTAIRDISPPPPPDTPFGSELKIYLVQLGRVFKGCSLKAMDRIVVTTRSSGSMCGNPLALNVGYVLSSGPSRPIDNTTRAELGSRTKVTQQVSIAMCGYNRHWDPVPEEEKAVLRSYEKIC